MHICAQDDLCDISVSHLRGPPTFLAPLVRDQPLVVWGSSGAIHLHVCVVHSNASARCVPCFPGPRRLWWVGEAFGLICFAGVNIPMSIPVVSAVGD